MVGLGGWPGSSVVAVGQWAVCGFGPRANEHARRGAYDMTVGARPYVLLRHEMRRRIESESSQAEACECGRDLRAVVLRHMS
jgi:hypothetical protein